MASQEAHTKDSKRHGAMSFPDGDVAGTVSEEDVVFGFEVEIFSTDREGDCGEFLEVLRTVTGAVVGMAEHVSATAGEV